MALSGLEDDQAVESKAALAKCLSKVGHMKKIIFKGGFSKAPDQRRRVVERNLALKKRLDGKDPLASVYEQSEAHDLASTSQGQSVRHSARHSVHTDDTIVLTEYSNAPPRDQVTYKELFDHINRIQKDYDDMRKTGPAMPAGI